MYPICLKTGSDNTESSLWATRSTRVHSCRGNFNCNKSNFACDNLQVKQNVQRTLATELQKLSVQFRKQQKAHLQQLRQNKEGLGGGSWLPDASTTTADDYDPGFSDMQVRLGLCAP